MNDLWPEYQRRVAATHDNAHASREFYDILLALLRELVEALDVGFIANGMYAQRPGGTAYVDMVTKDVISRSAVLALLEPKKPEPTYRAGDWIMLAGRHHAVLVNDAMPHQVLCRHSGTAMLNWCSADGSRPATADEIARARA